VGLSSVCTAGLGDGVEVSCVLSEIQTYFRGFSIPLLVKRGLLRISVPHHTGTGGWQQAKLPAEFIGEA